MSEPADRQVTDSAIVRIVQRFLEGPLSILIIVIAALLGVMAVMGTPREEEPQIVVPMADIHVNFPGKSPQEVERWVTEPLERILWQIEGVEHVYSISRRDQAMVTVRFHVGQDPERSMVRLRDDIEANRDIVPPEVTGWVVKPVKIDDVPIVTLTFFGDDYDGYQLRRLAEEMKARMARLENTSKVDIFGGFPREVLVEARLDELASRNLCLADLVRAIGGNNVPTTAGTVYQEGSTRRIVVGTVLKTMREVEQLVVASRGGRAIKVEDVATVIDGPDRPEWYTHIGFGPGSPEYAERAGRRLPAVTLAFSKKKGTNAVDVARNVIAEAEALKQSVLPEGVEMLVTRNYGRIANDKVNDLLTSMFFAVVTVVGLIAVTMGWREAVVVGMAVPISFALALFCNWMFGFTINRVTLFALILSLGLVVDDPITIVDNVQRHILMGLRRPLRATLFAVHEVLPPVIMSTLVIIVSFLPMFFITGMMGPYMGPMAVNVPVTVTFSTVCALTFVPWLSFRLLKRLSPRRDDDVSEKMKQNSDDISPVDTTPRWIRSVYRASVSKFLSGRGAVALFGIVFVLFIGSALLFPLRLVPLKMLPFDNKSELQLIVEMPEGTTLERTDAVVRELEGYLATVNEVTDYESYVGWNAPIDFNGLVRHYGLRRGPHQADVRINLVGKAERTQQSHAIALRIRDELTEIGRRHGALVKIVEVPPGPPVLSTLTVEVRGQPEDTYRALIDGAEVLQQRLADEDSTHIVEIDNMAESPHRRLTFEVDQAKAADNGLDGSRIAQALATAISGKVAGLLHAEHDREPTLITVRLPLDDRHAAERLRQIWIMTPGGRQVQLGELGQFLTVWEDQPIYHKDLERVVFVTAETAGRPPGEIVYDMHQRLEREPLPEGIEAEWAGEGEWQITVRVFRDLGIAFGIAMVGIYLLMTVQMKSFAMPLIVMTAIPLTVIGIAPGFWLLNVVTNRPVAGYPTPVFFTATSMIGMIALGGIVIRNSIVLIEFIQGALAEGKPLREAIIESGAVRFRPIVLTAGTTLLGAWPITLDPVFSGLAWALIFGLVASTLFTLLVVPTVYYVVESKRLKD